MSLPIIGSALRILGGAEAVGATRIATAAVKSPTISQQLLSSFGKTILQRSLNQIQVQPFTNSNFANSILSGTLSSTPTGQFLSNFIGSKIANDNRPFANDSGNGVVAIRETSDSLLNISRENMMTLRRIENTVRGVDITTRRIENSIDRLLRDANAAKLFGTGGGGQARPKGPFPETVEEETKFPGGGPSPLLGLAKRALPLLAAPVGVVTIPWLAGRLGREGARYGIKKWREYFSKDKVPGVGDQLGKGVQATQPDNDLGNLEIVTKKDIKFQTTGTILLTASSIVFDGKVTLPGGASPSGSTPGATPTSPGSFEDFQSPGFGGPGGFPSIEGPGGSTGGYPSGDTSGGPESGGPTPRPSGQRPGTPPEQQGATDRDLLLPGGAIQRKKSTPEGPTDGPWGASPAGSWKKISEVPVSMGRASIRYNNPGAAWPSKRDEKYGILGYGILKDGNRIGHFPTPVHGASSNFDLWSRVYVGKTLRSAIKMWRGGNDSAMPKGLDPNMVITPELARNKKFMVDLFEQMAKVEAGHKNPMTREQWEQAFDWFSKGGVPDKPPSKLDKTTGPETPEILDDRLSGSFQRKQPGMPETSPRTELAPTVQKPLAAAPDSVQMSRPFHMKGQITLPGVGDLPERSFKFGSGGGGPSVPYGQFAVRHQFAGHKIANYLRGEPGAAKQHTYNVDAGPVLSGIRDAKAGWHRREIQIHMTPTNQSQWPRTAGCLGIGRDEYPAFAAQMNALIKKHGSIFLSVGPGEGGVPMVQIQTPEQAKASPAKTISPEEAIENFDKGGSVLPPDMGPGLPGNFEQRPEIGNTPLSTPEKFSKTPSIGEAFIPQNPIGKSKFSKSYEAFRQGPLDLRGFDQKQNFLDPQKQNFLDPEAIVPLLEPIPEVPPTVTKPGFEDTLPGGNWNDFSKLPLDPSHLSMDISAIQGSLKHTHPGAEFAAKPIVQSRDKDVNEDIQSQYPRDVSAY